MPKTEMERALEADGEKLRQLIGEDHGPFMWCEVWTDWPSGPCYRPECREHGCMEAAVAVTTSQRGTE